MEFDYSKLLGRVIEKLGSQAKLAEYLGMGESALSNRMNNKVHFSPDEIWEICDPACLDIPGEEIHVYFFTPKVLNSRTA